MQKDYLILISIVGVSILILVFVAVSIGGLGEKTITGNIVFQGENKFKLGDELRGKIKLSGSFDSDEALVFFLLTKNDKVIDSKTINFEELSQYSENSESDVIEIKLEKVIDYRFDEKGNYLLRVMSPKTDNYLSKMIYVK
jgi:hypothetical protein